MKIPAIKGKIGSTVFYSAQMTLGDIAQYVSKISNELYSNPQLNEQIQRSLTQNVDNIVKYLIQQDDRFFNSIVLAMYEGNPQWIEVTLDFPSEENKTYNTLGFLELSGQEIIFPVDGQHRVEAIKKAISIKPELKDETIGIIFVGYSVKPDGVKKIRRIFSTLNRYAKPVSTKDIIALDEDDIVAITTRMLLSDNEFFQGNRIAMNLNKSIAPTDTTSFTSIITLSECNQFILECFLNHPSSKKLKDFIRVRPEESTIQDFYNLLTRIWDIMQEFPDIIEYKAHAKAIRNSNTGGSLLFRPVGLTALFRACCKIHRAQPEQSIEDIFLKLKNFDFNLSNELWEDLLWSNKNHKMIMERDVFVSSILVYIYDKSLLSAKDINSLKVNLSTYKQNLIAPLAFLDKFCLEG